MKAHLLIEMLRDSSSPADMWSAQMIHRAEKIALDPSVPGDAIDQRAEEFARELLAHGVFPLPYDVTLFEFGPSIKAEGKTIHNWLWALLWKAEDGPRERLLMRTFTMPVQGGDGVIANPALAGLGGDHPSVSRRGGMVGALQHRRHGPQRGRSARSPGRRAG